jgi:hypothetical protein
MNTISGTLVIYIFNLFAFAFLGTCSTVSAYSDGETGETRTSFELSQIDGSITREFVKAWNHSHNGVDNVEALVFIFRNLDGSYWATAQGPTNESNKVRFKWDPAAIALVHTHPTSLDPKPSTQDMRVGDRFGVPIFTISRWGMFMYDPNTRRVTKIRHNLDWLVASKWSQAYQSIPSK